MQPDGEASTSHVVIEETGIYGIGRKPSQSIHLQDRRISGEHAELTVNEGSLTIRDLSSVNGTKIGSKAVTGSSIWKANETLTLAGCVEIRLESLTSAGTEPKQSQAEIIPDDVSRHLSIVVNRTIDGKASQDVISRELYENQNIVDFSKLRASGLEIKEVDFIAVGGGIGSFTWVDHLRVFGVARDRIAVVGHNPVCYANYERYCRASQIPRHERLRSNSASTPDNVWGFPGYALREAIAGVRENRLADLKGVFAVFGEPVFAESYTPRAGQVFESLDREMSRIGWSDMFVNAVALAMRKMEDGRYVVFCKRAREQGGKDKEERYLALVGKVAHLATGYPAVNFVSDLANFRVEHPGHRGRVVNAYLPHDQVYEDLMAAGGGTVVVRGRGIVASRILQKLSEVRKRGAANLQIIHLMRTMKGYKAGARYKRTRRSVFNDVDVQPFNWPKACWGGQLRTHIEGLNDADRSFAMTSLGGTTTAARTDWIEIAETGEREGWYKKIYGSVKSLNPAGAARVEVTVERAGTVERTDTLAADYVLDCTGLIADVGHSNFLSDLIDTYGLKRNRTNSHQPDAEARLGGLSVTNDFELDGMRTQSGRVYGSGQICGGGPYAPVDSFLGLQYAALRSVDHLTSHDFDVPSMTPVRSARSWLKWCRNLAP